MNMNRNFKTATTACLIRGVAVAALCAAMLAAPLAHDPGHAQDKPDAGKVVATVNGDPITQSDLELAREDFGPNLQRYPAPQHQEILIDLIVNLRLMADAAQKAGYADSEAFKERLEYTRGRLLRDLYFEKEIEGAVSEEEVRKAYEEVTSGEPPEELRARHILVKTEDEAKELVTELEGGKDFAELAKEKSTGPTGPRGGDLDYFTQTQVVPAFWNAAAALEPGNISAPVETQFGWHVIKLEDRRKKQPPAFEEVKDQVRQVVVRNKFAEVLAGLKEKAKIEMAEPPAAADAPQAQEEKSE